MPVKITKEKNNIFVMGDIESIEDIEVKEECFYLIQNFLKLYKDEKHDVK